MNYQELKKEIKAIAEVAADVPEAFQIRCFEILLQSLLAEGHTGHSSQSKEEPAAGNETAKNEPSADRKPKALPLPSQVRVFMTRTSVTEEELSKLVLVEDGEVHFIKEPTGVKISQGQVAWSLLLALKSGFLANTDLIIVCEGMNLLDGNQAQRLETCFQYRNHSAHPGLAPIDDPNVVAFFSDISAIVLRNPKFNVAPVTS